MGGCSAYQGTYGGGEDGVADNLVGGFGELGMGGLANVESLTGVQLVWGIEMACGFSPFAD